MRPPPPPGIRWLVQAFHDLFDRCEATLNLRRCIRRKWHFGNHLLGKMEFPDSQSDQARDRRK